jgi:hypothetical protein
MLADAAARRKRLRAVLAEERPAAPLTRRRGYALLAIAA